MLVVQKGQINNSKFEPSLIGTLVLSNQNHYLIQGKICLRQDLSSDHMISDLNFLSHKLSVLYQAFKPYGILCKARFLQYNEGVQQHCQRLIKI